MEKAPPAQAPAGETGGNGGDGPQGVFGIKEAVVSKNDPLMMLVTLHQGFLADYEKVLGHHKQAVTAVMEQATGSAVQDIRGAVGELRNKTLESSLRNTLAGISEEVGQYKEHKAEMREWGGRLVFRQKLLAWLMLAICLAACLTWVASLYALRETLQALP